MKISVIGGGCCVQGAGCLTKYVEEKELLWLVGTLGSRKVSVD